MSVVLRLVPRGADSTMTQMFFVCSGHKQVPPSCTELNIECKLERIPIYIPPFSETWDNLYGPEQMPC
jgi:hypothetical protein